KLIDTQQRRRTAIWCAVSSPQRLTIASLNRSEQRTLQRRVSGHRKLDFLTESACAISEMFLIRRPFFGRQSIRGRLNAMAKPKKKKSSAKKSAARKTRRARKIHAKKAASKRSARGAKPARRSTKSRQQSMKSPAILLGLNHRERKLDPCIRQQTQKLLQLRDVVVY